MKGSTSDNKLQSISEDEFDSFRQIKSNTNADIDYLLTFVSVKEKQQLNLVQNQQQQNKSKCTLDTQTISEYITQNSSRQSQSVEERSNLISFIDMGLRMINRVKKLMVRKKPQIKNGSKPNQLDLIKDLFFPFDNNNNRQKQATNNNKQTQVQSQSQQMKMFRIQRQIDMLLHKYESQNIKDVGNTKYKYLLTLSMHEQLLQQQTKCDKQIVLKLINQLQNTLNKLQQMMVNNKDSNKTTINSKITQQKYKIIQTVWNLIDQLSVLFNNHNNNK